LGTVLAFVLSLIVQVGYPLAVTLYFRRKTGASWLLFVYGAVIFALFQLFTWLPLSVYLDVVVGGALDSELHAFVWLLTLALLTSLVEEGGRLVGYRYLFPRGNFRANWRNGVMYSLGHGSVETLLLIAGLTFVHFLAYLVLSRSGSEPLLPNLPGGGDGVAEAVAALIETTWSQPLIVALERVLALPHQVAWGLLVMQSIVSRQKRWFGFAVLYHTSVAVIVPGRVRLTDFAVAESVNVLLAVLSLWIIIRLRAVYLDEAL
jgi:uncharacterized membrane protein YhfC